MILTTMVSALEVKRRHENQLLHLPGVIGVGLGRKEGKECIYVYVQEDSPKLLSTVPRSLEDIPVEVIVTGTFEAR